MAFAVIMYLDPTTEAHVRALQASLADQGISSATEMMDVRPHISLAGIERLVAQPVCAMLKAFAQNTPSLTVKLSAVGTFPTEKGVVYLAPVVTAELVKLHEKFHAQLADLGLLSHEYYRPDNWIPHCTVAINLPLESVPAAVDICRRSNTFHEVRLTEIALVEFVPVQEICVFPFGG